MDDRTYDDALTALASIVDRYQRLIDNTTERRTAAHLKVERDAVQAALDELREGPEDVEQVEDDRDVPAVIADLARWLDAGNTPPHPLAGVRGDGQPGHCWACRIVGHPVAHPGRACREVGCTVQHGVPAERRSAAAVPDGDGRGEPVGWRPLAVDLGVSPFEPPSG